MLRKPALLLTLSVLIAVPFSPRIFGQPAPTAPRYQLKACAGADPKQVLPPVQKLFTGHPETRAVLVLADGCTAAKAYLAGYSDDTRFISWSMAKTVTAMLVGELVADGKLQLDAPAPIAEWHKPGDPRGQITLRQMLHMSSGLDHIEVGDPVEKSDTNQTLFVAHTGAMAAAAINHPLATPPGSKFRYSSLTTLILSEIITRTVTDSRDPRTRARAYADFAQARLFGPAGITTAKLDFDGAGTQIGGSILYMSLDDWGRTGELLLDGKSRDGRPVIDPQWIAFMKAPSPTNAEYGGQTWLNRTGGVGSPTLFPGKGPDTAVAMNGHLGQLVIASPDSGPGRGLVVVRLGNTPDSRNPALMQALGDVVKVFDRKGAIK